MLLNKIRITIILYFVAVAICQGQHQLILLKNEKVLGRYREGERIRYRLKGSSEISKGLILGIYDSAFRTDRDTIPIHKIDRVYANRTMFHNKLGASLVIGGTGLFLIDQFNTVIIQKESFSTDAGVTRASIIAVGAGLPLMLIKKRYYRIRYPSRILCVNPESPFYYHDKMSFFSDRE